MFVIDPDKTIHITRGDMATIEVSCRNADENPYEFQPTDTVRLKVFERRNCANVFLEKTVTVSEPALTVDIHLDETDTRIGDIINKPVDYWYEIELNHDRNPQTIIAYDTDGPKIFRIYPEGGVRE